MWLRHYKIHDHLGNIRSVIKDFGTGNYEIASQYDYKPFGGVLSNSGEDERQTFIGKEKDEESSLGDFGVRKYDDLVGRFFQIDPLWEKYYGWTPYQYSYNNPVGFLDRTGNEGFSSSDLWMNQETVLREEGYSEDRIATIQTGFELGSQTTSAAGSILLGGAVAYSARYVIGSFFLGNAGKITDIADDVINPFAMTKVSSSALKSVDDIIGNPTSVWGKSVDDIINIFKKEGIEVKIRSSNIGSGKATIIDVKKHSILTQIEVHPGGGRHGGAYYRVSTSTQGTFKIVDPETYIPGKQEKARIIPYNE